MSPWRARLAWTMATLAFLLLPVTKIVGTALAVPNEDIAFFVPVLLGGFAMCAVGGLIAARTTNPIGWIFIAIVATVGLSVAAGMISDATHAGVATPPRALLITSRAVGDWMFFLSLGLLISIFYLFPDGRLPSRRWRWPWRVYVGALAVTVVGFAVQPHEDVYGDVVVTNPLGVAGIDDVLGPILGVAGLLLVLSSFAAFASLVTRYRGAGPDGRQQIRWLFLVGAVGGVLLVSGIGLSAIGGDVEGTPAANAAQVLLVALVVDIVIGIPVTTAIAIFRYHLYDLNVVVRKALVFGLLATFITGVYVAVVVVVGGLAEGGNDAVLSVAATAVVAVLFQPVRGRVEHLAARLVYGERATPYEVMAGFSERVAATVSVDEVLPEMAAAAGEGVGAVEVAVRVYLSDGRERVERWTTIGETERRAAAPETIEVAYQGKAIGEIDVTTPAAEPLSSAERRLLDDLAGQAGLALHNVRLTEELALRVAELDEQTAALRVSRERLVTARDAQRRGLQRDIAEGSERELIEIARGLDEVAGLAATEPQLAGEQLDRLGARTNAALEGLRDLARGIFPPLLADRGIVPALEAHIRKVGARAAVDAAEGFAVRRFAPDVEACVYFCCLQTIQNVMRHADNAPCTVRISVTGDSVEVEIADEGPGFSPSTTARGMGLAIVQDRVDALEGTLSIASGDDGTRLRIVVPLAADAMAG